MYVFQPCRIFLLACLPFSAVYSQQIVVEPYLQDAEPDRITIMWETDANPQSSVLWGTTPQLGNSTSGTAVTGNGMSQIHTVHLIGLQPFTKYYYKVSTNGVESAVYEFISPALAADEKTTRIIAMSDMQQDGGNPTKFDEVVHNGVFAYATDSLGPDLVSSIQMVIIPGDLVDNGFDYSQWKDDFFAPSHPLFSYVPVYPVLGNHEQNTPSYFKYFTLPQNGSPGYEEHWWYKDHSNLRIIGLNSNSGYQIQAQLDWLDSVLANAASDPEIDFVFVQLHHPHKSELWLAGETNFTGQVIQRLEDFSTATGKPSIHFFGHTHGYSRGQSRDHNHVMVNVATAGGNIDYWGEFAQNDYDEFTISQDEYGFVFVQVEAGANPKFTLKRFSIGDENNVHPNTLEDLITVKKNNNAPFVPLGIFPATNDVVNPDCLVLKANDFFDADNDGFGAAQWQISTNCADFSTPVMDSWKQYQNWYNEVDTQAGDDLTDEKVTTLQANTTYCWRVRYRDKSLAWSDWSAPIPFSTGTSAETPNLLSNNGAENLITGWTTTAGALEALTSGECDGTSPFAGVRYFAVGALCVENAFGSAYQDVDVSAYATSIDQGVALAKFGGYLRDWNGTDVPAFAIQFFNSNQVLLAGSDTTSFSGAQWSLMQDNWAVPSGTRTIRYILMGTRNSGVDNDSYLDELYLRLNLNGDSCSEWVNTTAIHPEFLDETQMLQVYPNPVTETAFINIPNTDGAHLTAVLLNSAGQEIKRYPHVHGPTFSFARGETAAGMYYMVVYKKDLRIGYAKVFLK